MIRALACAAVFLAILGISFAEAAPIHEAVARRDMAALEVLLKNNPSLVNARDETGATPLHWAADRGGAAIAEMLLAHGADANAAKRDGVTPLHVAAGLNRRDIVELLLAKGASIDSKDRRGRTAYTIARLRNLRGIAEFLASKGAATVMAAEAKPGRAISHRSATVCGYPVEVISVDTTSPRVRLKAAIARNGIGRTESFGSFLQRFQPDAAINGTFFSKKSLKPVGDIVIDGKLAYFGGMGTGLCISADNKISFVGANWARHTDWSAYDTVICCGPRLVSGGRIAVDTTGFHDPHVLGRGQRIAVGTTDAGKLILVGTRRACTLTELACIMRDLGCTEAINFDGGSSSAMYCAGKTLRSPGRQLTNVLLVYESK